MTEQNNQGQNTGQTPKTPNQSTTAGASTNTEQTRTGPGDANWVPRDRMSAVSRENAQLKQQLAQIESEREQREEERQKKQGEYQQLSEKYKKQAETEKQKRIEVERSWQREKRLNVWHRAASGVIKQEAIGDAFDMLDDDDFKEVDDTDDVSMRRLADQLAERKPYLSDGPRGAGSGGSRFPVSGSGDRGGSGGNGGQRRLTGGKEPILKNRRRRPWK